MYCSNCGNEINGTALFCSKCGNKIGQQTSLQGMGSSGNSDSVSQVTKYSYLSIEGRVGRLNYFTKYFLPSFILSFFGALLVESESSAVLIGLLLLCVAIMIGLCGIAKRLHDINLSAWFMLLNLIPFVGFLLGFLWLFIPGTKWPNKYGSPEI